MSRKQYVVIGSGKFGTSVAKTLYSLGNDVLVIDKDEALVQEISNSVTHAVQMDASDENALRTIGIRNFDVAIVAIGDNIQSSIMITLLLKELGINKVVAKANNEQHAKVLRKIGADRVVLPEKDMGIRVAHSIASSNILEYIELSDEYSILEMEVPQEWKNKSLIDLKLRSKFRVNIMAIKNGKDINISPEPDRLFKERDIIVAIGSAENLNKLENKVTK